MSDDEYDVWDIFDIPRNHEADEHLAEVCQIQNKDDSPIPAYEQAVLEITINIPPLAKYRKSSLIEKISMYQTLWKAILNAVDCQTIEHSYQIELCASGLPHLHGYVKYTLSTYSPAGLVMDCVRAVYKLLPRGAWGQIAKNPYNHHLARFKAPALCINHKKILYKQWCNYMNKDARPNS